VMTSSTVLEVSGSTQTKMGGLNVMGSVGIGTTGPQGALHVVGINKVAADWANVNVMSSDAVAIDKGGTLGFGGVYAAAGSATVFANIAGRKENATDANYAGYLAFATGVQGTGPTEKVRITSTGNVGIGTTDPKGLFDVSGTTISSSGGLSLKAGGELTTMGGNDLNINVPNTRSLFIKHNGTTKMTMDNTGNVGIGTASPISRMQVNNPSGATSNSWFGTNDFNGSGGVGSGLLIDFGASSGNTYTRLTAASAGWTAYNNLILQSGGGNVGIGTVTPDFKLRVEGTLRAIGITDASDSRLKKDVVPLTDSLNKVASLRGVHYKWKDPTAGPGPQIGLIAQEVERVFPELVETDSAGLKSLNYSHLVAPLIDAVKELQGEIETLRAENSALKVKNDIFETRVSQLEKRIK